MEKACPLCSPENRRVVGANSLAVAVLDAFPVSPGHTLILPRRHIASVSEATSEEFAAIWSLLAEVRADTIGELKPDGFNVGINDGRAAGQTVMHLHVHLIPRYAGDSPDPRGGLRWVLPREGKVLGLRWPRSPTHRYCSASRSFGSSSAAAIAPRTSRC